MHLKLDLDPAPLGSVEGECPYCETTLQLRRHRVLPRWVGAAVIFPSTEILVCPACEGIARHESMLDRLLSALFLVPFLLLLAAVIATGLYMLGAMVATRHVSADYVAIAGLLLVAAGYSEFRAVRGFRRLLAPRRMLPMAGWGTDL